MTKKNIFNVVEDVKKTLESDRHYIYAVTNKVYNVRNFEITSISSEGAIRIYNKRTNDVTWFNFNQLMTKTDAENEKRKYLETTKQNTIDRYNRYIEEYKQKIKELEEG